jgi:photosystem II stability/assembly factor-like uncharacterized protein/tetratricopeptide (TPR) repeat protein
MFASLFLAVFAAVADPAAAPLEDARLNDVFFVDAQHGWTVGDHGMIWSTEDGGRVWRPQTSNASCSLQSVCFCSPQVGWAAGGYTHPFTHVSTGVLLTTTDGGKTWAEIPKTEVPLLHRVRFFNAQHGWAVGCRSAMYPSGIFLTNDGGKRWLPVPGNIAADWTAADFFNPNTGAIVGRHATAGVVKEGVVDPARPNVPELINLTRVQLVPPNFGWMVGDGGAVRFTSDGGTTWTHPPTALPAAASQFDFSALAARGPSCWIAGTPGARVFHTADAGRTWDVCATGSNVPLRAMTFVDDQHGWAVGDLGTILATTDGGRTWQRQRSGGARAASLMLLSEPNDVPLEWVANIAGSEGYLTVVNAIGRRDIEIPLQDAVPTADRLHEAVVRVGGSSTEIAWQFPLRQSGLPMSGEQIVSMWDNLHDGRCRDHLQAYLVRQIRLWRPEVVITCEPSGKKDDSLTPLLHQAVLLAVGQAADANAFASQKLDAGLDPWAVKRVFAILPSESRGRSDWSANDFSPRLGCSPAEAAIEPRGILFDHFTAPPTTQRIRLLFSTAAQEQGQEQRDLFAGINLQPGGTSRRLLPQRVPEGMELRQRMSQRRRHVLAILENAGRTTGRIETLLAQIDNLCRDLDDDSRGQILYQLADRYCRAGQLELASESFQILLNRYPQHAMAPQALLWLVQYHASDELSLQIPQVDRKKRLEQAIAFGRQAEQASQELFADPRLCFPLAVAYRELGQVRQAEQIYQMQIGGVDSWSICARGELRRDDSKSKNRQFKTTLACHRTSVKPHLDGVLDEDMWRQAKPATLQSEQHDDGNWPTTALLAYDDEFLYFAARCRTAATNAERQAEQQRARDTDLSGHDRVELLIDVDRDFTTYDRLAVDHRGWTNDDCWGDRSWNPQWFVATKQDGNAWTVEAAIPLAELSSQRPRTGTTWAVGIQRVVPQVGFQSWTVPAAVSILPSGFGYVVFR